MSEGTTNLLNDDNVITNAETLKSRCQINQGSKDEVERRFDKEVYEFARRLSKN